MGSESEEANEEEEKAKASESETDEAARNPNHKDGGRVGGAGGWGGS
jgi:hypothetical protein